MNQRQLKRLSILTALLAIQFVAFAAMAASPKTAVEERTSAVNRALMQSLAERAKSQREFERNAAAGRPRESALLRKQQRDERAQERSLQRLQRSVDRAASRERADERMDSRLDQDSREARAQNLDLREEARREQRLNWLNE